MLNGLAGGRLGVLVCANLFDFVALLGMAGKIKEKIGAQGTCLG